MIKRIPIKGVYSKRHKHLFHFCQSCFLFGLEVELCYFVKLLAAFYGLLCRGLKHS